MTQMTQMHSNLLQKLVLTMTAMKFHLLNLIKNAIFRKSFHVNFHRWNVGFAAVSCHLLSYVIFCTSRFRERHHLIGEEKEKLRNYQVIANL